MDVSSGLFDRVSKMISRLGREIETAAPSSPAAPASPAGAASPEVKPVPVQIVDQTSPWQVLSALPAG